MKHIKKILQLASLAAILFFTKNVNSQTISSHYFGENAWMPDTIGNAKQCTEPPCVLNGKLYQEWGNIKNSKAALIRFGGVAADRNMPTDYQYIKMIDSIRGNGMEPIIQVPFCNNRYTAQQAADIVNYINIIKGKHIKYWIIGNEPNLGYSYTTSAQIANYIRPFASAMKKTDPTILIIGPELAWFDQTLIDNLTTPNGPDDITGKDGAGKYYIDVFSFHTYPFNGTQTRDQVISKLTAAGSLSPNLDHLNTRIAAANSVHNRTGASAITTAITEANVCYQNSSSDNINGVGANSFIGGQFVAELLCIGMKKNVDFVNVWSVIEGNSASSNIGYIDAATNTKKPLYYHFKLLAENFGGNYINGTSNVTNVKAFGSRDSKQISVLLLNEDLSQNYTYTVKLDNTTITESSPLKINMDAGLSKEYSETVDNQTSLLLVFDLSGNIVRKIEYKLNGNADNNLPPTVTEMAPVLTSVPTLTPETSATFNASVYPNPSSEFFNIKVSSTGLEKITVNIFDMTGRLCLNMNELEVDKEVKFGANLTPGYYIAEVNQGIKKQTIKFIKTQ